MKESAQILPRDKLLRDNFTPAETTLFVVILAMSLLTYWIGDPRSFSLLGSLLIIGCLTPLVLKTHEHTHPFFVDLLWPKFWICTAPAWALVLQFVIGLTQNPMSTLIIGGTIFHTIDSVSTWRPTTVTDGTTWVPLLGFGATYVMLTSVYIVPKSRSFFERILPWICLSAVLVALFGYIQQGLEVSKPFLTKGTGATDFFAFFPYDGHWAAFASLWCCVCIAMALLSTRYDDSPTFIHSTGPWYLTGGALLGASGFLVEALLPAAILLFTFSTMLLIVTADFLANSKDTHRTPIAISSGLAACLSFAGAIFKFFQDQTFSANSSLLRSAAYDMFKANPIFGWGIDSYGTLLPFFSNDLLLANRSDRAASDLLQFLAEFGIFGFLVTIGFLTAFTVRYLRGQHNIRLTNHLLIGCGSVLILALCDTPFMSPAVFFSFFFIFFTALRWAELSRNKVDEVDAARTQLVTSEKLRGVPFFNKPYQETENEPNTL